MSDRFPRPLTVNEGERIAREYPPAEARTASCSVEIAHPEHWNRPVCCTRPSRHADGPHVRHVTRHEADYCWW